MAQSKKRGKGLVVFLIILVVVAAAAAYVGMPYWKEYKAKEASYNEALQLMEAGEYCEAKDLFLQAGDYEDAAAQVEVAYQMMAQPAQQQAQILADKGFHMIAGLYLTEKLEDTELFTTRTHNETVALIEDYYAMSQARCDEIMAVDEKLPMIPMQEFFEDLEAMGDQKNPDEALRILEGITSYPLFIQLFQKCWDDGFFVETSLDALAEACPQWVPIMDKMIAATENLDVMELIARQ